MSNPEFDVTAAADTFFEQVSEAAGIEVSPPEQSLVIWKFPLLSAYNEPFLLDLPIGAKFCAMAALPTGLQSWFLVNPAADKETRRFLLTGTNHRITGFVAYLDNSMELAAGPNGAPKVLVTHLIELEYYHNPE